MSVGVGVVVSNLFNFLNLHLETFGDGDAICSKIEEK